MVTVRTSLTDLLVNRRKFLGLAVATGLAPVSVSYGYSLRNAHSRAVAYQSDTKAHTFSPIRGTYAGWMVPGVPQRR